MTGRHASCPTTSLHPPSTTQPSAVAQRAQAEGAGLAPKDDHCKVQSHFNGPTPRRSPAAARCGCRAGPKGRPLLQSLAQPPAVALPLQGVGAGLALLPGRFVSHTPPRPLLPIWDSFYTPPPRRSFPSWPPRIQPATRRIRPSWPRDSNGRTNRRIQAAPILAQFQSPSWTPSPQARRSRKNRAKRNETNRIPCAPSPAETMLAWSSCRLDSGGQTPIQSPRCRLTPRCSCSKTSSGG